MGKKHILLVEIEETEPLKRKSDLPSLMFDAVDRGLYDLGFSSYFGQITAMNANRTVAGGVLASNRNRVESK